MKAIKGMGSYREVEEELSGYSADKMNELFLSGDLDKIYDDFERAKAKREQEDEDIRLFDVEEDFNL